MKININKPISEEELKNMTETDRKAYVYNYVVAIIGEKLLENNYIPEVESDYLPF